MRRRPRARATHRHGGPPVPTDSAPPTRTGQLAAADHERRRRGGRRADPWHAGDVDRLAAHRRPLRPGHAARARRLQRPVARQLPPLPRPPPGQRRGRQDRLAAREPRRSGGVGRRASPAAPTSCSDPDLLDRFDVIGWDPRGTYDTAAGDRLHRRLRRVPHRRRHHARHARGAPAQHRPGQGVRGPLRRQERSDPPARRHQRLGARHGLDPPGARRGQDQLLRLQLRQRARGDVGDAVPRHRPGRRARRGQGPERRFPRLGSPAARRLRAHPRAVPRGLRGAQRVRVPQRRGTRARRSTR